MSIRGTGHLTFDKCCALFDSTSGDTRRWLDKSTMLEKETREGEVVFTLWFHKTQMAVIKAGSLLLTPQGRFDNSTLRRYKGCFDAVFTESGYHMPGNPSRLYPLLKEGQACSVQVGHDMMPLHNPLPETFDGFTRGYIECAMWSTQDEDEECPIDQSYGWWDIDLMSLLDVRDDCERFQKKYVTELTGYCIAREGESIGDLMDYAGHDYWLSRNGHGAGFFDRGNDKVFSVLQEAARQEGSSDLVIGGSGKLYFQ